MEHESESIPSASTSQPPSFSHSPSPPNPLLIHPDSLNSSQTLPQFSSPVLSQVPSSSTERHLPPAREHFKVPRKNQSKSVESPRIRAYPDGSAGPWVVFFRPNGKPLNIIQISRDLIKRFAAVTDSCKVRPSKLRVSVASLKQANEIAASELFTREYRTSVRPFSRG